MSRTRAVYIVLGIIALAFVFQVFLRYAYLTPGRPLVYRVDRLTGRVCEAAPDDECDATVVAVPPGLTPATAAPYTFASP